MYIVAIFVGVAASVGGFESRFLFWSCIAVAATAAIIATLTLEPVARRIGWPVGAAPPRLFVRFVRSDMTDTLTFFIEGPPVTKLIIEPLDPAVEAKISMDPSEVLFLHPNQPIKCSILVEEGTGQSRTLTGLKHLLEKKRHGKLRISVRFTNAEGKRKRVPFNVEIVGAHITRSCGFPVAKRMLRPTGEPEFTQPSPSSPSAPEQACAVRG